MEQPKHMMCRNKVCANYGMFVLEQKYCVACGHKTDNPPKCKYCASLISPHLNFCGECGKPNK